MIYGDTPESIQAEIDLIKLQYIKKNWTCKRQRMKGVAKTKRLASRSERAKRKVENLKQLNNYYAEIEENDIDD